jgi:hypothetical protein
MDPAKPFSSEGRTRSQARARVSQQQQQQQQDSAVGVPLGENRERGQLRGGARFAARNSPYYSSVRELLSRHQRLLETGPAVSTRYASVAGGTLLQTTVRFRADHSAIRQDLLRVFSDLFRQQDQARAGGFEVSVTFNAVLASRDNQSFSLFYGQDYRQSSESGTHSALTFASPVRVENLLQVHRIPHEFDFEQLLQQHRGAFESSDVYVLRFLNVVYLIYQYREHQHGASATHVGS